MFAGFQTLGIYLILTHSVGGRYYYTPVTDDKMRA